MRRRGRSSRPTSSLLFALVRTCKENQSCPTTGRREVPASVLQNGDTVYAADVERLRGEIQRVGNSLGKCSSNFRTWFGLESNVLSLSDFMRCLHVATF